MAFKPYTKHINLKGLAMLPIYFPTDIKTDKKPITASIDWRSIGKLQIRNRFDSKIQEQHRQFSEKADNTLLERFEQHPVAIMVNEVTILPLETITISDEESMRAIAGMDPEEGTMEVIGPMVMPNKYAACHGWGFHQSLTGIVADLFARATGLKTNKTISSPSSFCHNFKKTGYGLEQYNGRPRHRYDDFKDEGLVLYDKVWYRYVDSNLYDMVTNDLKHSDVNVFKAPAVIPIEGRRTNQQAYRFANSAEVYHNRRTYQPLILNHTVEVTDPDFGKKFFEELGIGYDVYDEVTFDEDGHVDTAIMLTGKHDFAVQKRNVVVIDTQAVVDLIEEGKRWCKEKSIKSGLQENQQTQTVTQDDGDLDFVLGGLGGFGSTSDILGNANLLLSVRDELTDDICVALTVQWQFDTIIRHLNKAFGGKINDFFNTNEPDDDIEPEERGFENGRVSRLAALGVFDRITKSIEIYLPIITPRFENNICSILRAHFTREQSMGNALVRDMGNDKVAD